LLIKPRQVRRSSKFQSRLRSQSRQRQEYAASVFSTAIVQGALSASLFLAALKAYQAVSAKAWTVGIMVKMALPLVFVLGGLWCARLCLKNLRAGREMWWASRKSKADSGAEADKPIHPRDHIKN
jgi:hypothetical protein